MSRRHHHHMQPYDYERFSDHSRDRDRERDQTRGIEYQDDSLSSINSDEESYLHHHASKEKKTPFYNVKSEPANKLNKADKNSNQETYHQKDIKTGNADTTSERLSRLEAMLEELIKRNNPPQGHSQTTLTTCEKGPNEQRGQFSLEPRRHDFTTSMWINKIQEVSVQNNWDEKTIISYMGSQMSGIIKAWYNSLPNYDYTWPEWKILISKVFPDNTDFVTTLKRLVTRLKQADETMNTYYFSKMYLIEACKITGEDAVSCLIDGLNNQAIQEQAKTQNFLTPETLYSQFLTVLPEYTVDYSPTIAPSADAVLNNWYYQEHEPDIEEVQGENTILEEEQLFEYEKEPRNEEFVYRNKNFREDEEATRKSPPKRSAPVHSRLDKRFIRPHNFRHQNKIPMAAKVCSICLSRGHLARNCRKAEKVLECKVNMEHHTNCFFKECTIKGRRMDAFIDSGCTSVLIKESVANDLGLDIIGTSDFLQVYGGGSVLVIGETHIALEVDRVIAKVKAMIVPDPMQEVSVIIGQGFLNQRNMCMVLGNEKLKIFEAAPYKLTD